MTFFVNSFEGQPSGTTLTAANSGGSSGDAFNTVTIGTGATAAFDNTHPAHGANALKVATSGTAAQVTVLKTGLSGANGAARFYLYLSAIPVSNVNICNWRTAAGVFQMQIRLQSTGKLQLINQAGTAVAGSTTANALPTGQLLRVECYGITFNAATGAATLAYSATADSPTATETLSVTNQNFGSTVDRVAIGVLGTNVANVGPIWFDDFAVNDTGQPIGRLSLESWGLIPV